MELRYQISSAKSIFCCILVLLLNTECQAQLCTGPAQVPINENSPVGTVVTTIITTEQNVIFTLQENPESAFRLDGSNVLVNKLLDFEALPNAGALSISIQCSKDGFSPATVRVIVLVKNVNDNPPVFTQSEYTFIVKELLPIGTSVAKVEATDQDFDTLFYHLENEYFQLQAVNSPVITVKRIIDYDVIKQVKFTLSARDTPEPGLPGEVSHTATATITLNIEDVDNRPPWFQPCTETNIGSAKICLNSGYRGRVNLTEQEVGVLQLEPGPLYAIDGDKGRNEQIIYNIVAGNEAGIFLLNENNGNITMEKPADVPGPIVLTVLASQLSNRDQFATSSVTFEVVKKSKNPPKFEKQQYKGYISSDSIIGSMVLEDGSLNTPLKVQATDEDFSDGVNPDVTYKVQDSSDFAVTAEGFVLLRREVSSGTFSLQLQAVDTTNGESGVAALSVQVLPGSTTTLSTTSISTTDMATESPQVTYSTTQFPSSSEFLTTPEEPTTASTEEAPRPTSISTTDMATESPQVTYSTTQSPSSSESLTTPEEPTTASTERVPGPSGKYRDADMAILGVSLAVVVLLCLAIIGLLTFRIRKGDEDWKKLSEASIFRSTLGSTGPKEGMQYTNSGFQNDEDSGSVVSDIIPKLDVEPEDKSTETALEKQAPLTTTNKKLKLEPDTTSLDESDQADSERGVKPILTKERRNEDGYKSVWFKEDIDPEAKEEVVIIPDNGDHEGDEDEDSMLGEDVSPPGTPGILHTNGASDSEGEEENNAEL